MWYHLPFCHTTNEKTQVSKNNKEEKWWRHKNYICEIMGEGGIPRKNKMRHVHLPKFSLLVQVGGEI